MFGAFHATEKLSLSVDFSVSKTLLMLTQSA